MKDFDRDTRSLAKELVPLLIESALIYGELTDADFKNKKTIIAKVKRGLPKKDENLYFHLIHHDGLLKSARGSLEREEWDYVYVFYATYFEHFINEVISIWACKNKKSSKSLKGVIRGTNIDDKFSWLLEVLGFPRFDDKHFKTIKLVSERRNSFIHYKYEPVSAMEPLKKKKEEWEKISDEVRAAVAYTRNYRSRVIWRGQKQKILSMLRN